MQYRTLGSRVTEEISALGFGCMRFPTLGTASEIDRSQADPMLKFAIDHGVNYVDTAWPYHGGESEIMVGEVLAGGYRDKILLATKMPMREINESADLDRIFTEQLRKLQTDHIDFYLLHSLSRKSWQTVQRVNVLAWAERLKEQGKIRYFGFSFHDEYDIFKEIVDEYDNWTFCQVQYNFMDVNFQAGRRGVEYAAAKDMAIVAMEPLRGGRLGKEPPAAVADVWASAPQKRSQVEWALQWVWNQPEVSLALSGMSTMEQVEQNVEYAGHSGPNSLSADETALINRAEAAYRGRVPIPCTSCRYCMPCPNGVEIPGVFQVFNDAVMYNNPQAAISRYSGRLGFQPEQLADQCIECGECLEACPQSIPIPDWMKEVHAMLGSKQDE